MRPATGSGSAELLSLLSRNRASGCEGATVGVHYIRSKWNSTPSFPSHLNQISLRCCASQVPLLSFSRKNMTSSLQVVTQQGKHLVTSSVFHSLARELEPEVLESLHDGHKVQTCTIDVHPCCGTAERLGNLQEGHERLLA